MKWLEKIKDRILKDGKDRGISLTELMVVLLIIAVLMAAVMILYPVISRKSYMLNLKQLIVRASSSLERLGEIDLADVSEDKSLGAGNEKVWKLLQDEKLLKKGQKYPMETGLGVAIGLVRKEEGVFLRIGKPKGDDNARPFCTYEEGQSLMEGYTEGKLLGEKCQEKEAQRGCFVEILVSP